MERLSEIEDEDEISYAWFSPLPPGARFIPTDEDLISKFLKPKIQNKPLEVDFFIEDDLYLYHPQEFAENYKANKKEGVWYVFTPISRKYANGKRPNRSAGIGYWKATGSDQHILNSDGEKIGYKKYLSYFEGKQPNGQKTGWNMQEYRINESQNPINIYLNSMVLDGSVLCKLYYKEIIRPRHPKMMENTPLEQSIQPNLEAPESLFDLLSCDNEGATPRHPKKMKNTPLEQSNQSNLDTPEEIKLMLGQREYSMEQ